MVRPPIREAARAKINLFLHVVGRRADGYHELDSLAVFPDVADIMQAEPACSLTLEIGGPFGAVLAEEADNLVLRAARLLGASEGASQKGPPGARLRLCKHLPVASGIGGGSADAAATLRVLARLWRLPPQSDLAAVARRLGADVPVCLESRPARMQGAGETLGPAPSLPSCGLALVNPGVPVSTAEVFRTRKGPFSGLASLPSRWPDASAMARDLAALSNDLEEPATALHPVIAEVLSALRACPDCLLARMSGSGATCFGLFADQSTAVRGGERLGRAGWWTWAGSL